ncbi:uncharacterized protein LOC144571997 [Carex rostrata]
MAPFSDYLSGGVNDLWLKPRILCSLTRDLDDTGDRWSRLFDAEELTNILEKVHLHGLLSEVLPEGYAGKDEAKLWEEWRSAVDAWVERLLLLVSDKMLLVHEKLKIFATKMLGVTIVECTSERLVPSYTVWFEKLLQNIQASSNNRFIYEASYACLSDLFTRLSSFPNVKKESTSFSGRLVQPILQLLDGDGSFMEAAIDLLCTLIKFYPSAIYRCYDKVESAQGFPIWKVIKSKSISKISCALALLPHAKGDIGSWSVIMQKLMISINLMLNDVFEGLEEEGKGSEIMKLLVRAGMEAPPLWHQKSKPQENTCNKKTPGINLTLTLLSYLFMLHHAHFLPSTTSLYQELLCSELPTFHLYILDLLIATIKGLKSNNYCGNQLLSHAASAVQPVIDYFRRATHPSIRAKIYYTLELLLHSMGVGMSLYLAEHVVSNASIDLDEGHESICISKLGNEASLKVSPKKRKRGCSYSQLNGVEEDTNSVIAGKKLTSLSVKIAALRAMDALLSVGGSLKSKSWRLEADRLLINLATKSLDRSTGKAGKDLCIGESAASQEEYCLVALQALLSSLLSTSHVRPPYLMQGLELFQKGKLEIGTEVATFCEKALLALEVLIHPRDIPLVNYPFPVASAVSINEFADEEMHPGSWDASDDEIQPLRDINGDTQPQLLEVDAQKSQGVEQERREYNREAATLSFDTEKIESSSVLPPQAPVDLLPSQGLQNTGTDTKYTVSQDTVDSRQGKKLYYDLLGNNSLKGKELMNDSDSESSDSAPPIVDGLDTD